MLLLFFLLLNRLRQAGLLCDKVEVLLSLRNRCSERAHVDELFNFESINQVYGQIIEYLGNLQPESKEKLQLWLFDDMCHLKPYSKKPIPAGQNETTEQFARIAKAVDKFHFPGHKKTDKYCQEKCNPNTELSKLNIVKQNTPACEQAFRWLNGFKNVKTMNEPCLILMGM